LQEQHTGLAGTGAARDGGVVVAMPEGAKASWRARFSACETFCVCFSCYLDFRSAVFLPSKPLFQKPAHLLHKLRKNKGRVPMIGDLKKISPRTKQPRVLIIGPVLEAEAVVVHRGFWNYREAEETFYVPSKQANIPGE
jgi:hypothetical protein